ncbi:MAG: four helix bundle protein [Terriglobales bacterium]
MINRDLQDNPTPESYRELPAWQNAIDLAAEVCRLTATWGSIEPPQAERDALVRDMRLAVAAIPAHIAAAHYCRHHSETDDHQEQARMALLQLETHLLRAQRWGLLERSAAAVRQQIAALGQQLELSVACSTAA